MACQMETFVPSSRLLSLLFFLMAVFSYLDVSRTSLEQRQQVTDSQYRALLENPNVIVTSANPVTITN